MPKSAPPSPLVEALSWSLSRLLVACCVLFIASHLLGKYQRELKLNYAQPVQQKNTSAVSPALTPVVSHTKAVAQGTLKAASQLKQAVLPAQKSWTEELKEIHTYLHQQWQRLMATRYAKKAVLILGALALSTLLIWSISARLAGVNPPRANH